MKSIVRSYMRVLQKGLSTSACLMFGALKFLMNLSSSSSHVTEPRFAYGRISGLHFSAFALKTGLGGYESIRFALTKRTCRNAASRCY